MPYPIHKEGQFWGPNRSQTTNVMEFVKDITILYKLRHIE